MTENKWLEKTWSFLLDPSQTAHWSPVGQRFSRALGGAGRRACCPTETGPVLTKEARQAQGLGWKSALHLSNPSAQGYPHSLGIQGLPNPEGLWSHSPPSASLLLQGEGLVPSFSVSADGAVRPAVSQICPRRPRHIF